MTRRSTNLLLALAISVVAASAVYAAELTRAMPFTTWAKLTRACGVRIAAPPVSNADGTHTITMTGDATQLACADKMLRKPVPGATP